MKIITRALRAAAAGAAGQLGGGGGTPGSTGLIIASAGANVNDGTGTAWTSPGNITASDGARANCNRASNGTSQLLYATFDLSSVPDGSVITGVKVRGRRDYSTFTPPQQIRDNTIRLTKDGSTMVGSNLADTSTDWIQNLLTNIDYGGEGDLWGVTLTAAEVKAPTFGVMMEVAFTVTASANARVDAVWIEIFYES